MLDTAPHAVEGSEAGGTQKMPRSILITGCSSGIGYHSAKALKERGWRVFAACRRLADCERLAAEGFETVRLDYAEPASIEAAVAEVLASTGGTLDALFNNGAYSHPGAIEDVSAEHLRAVLETNVVGWYDLIRRVLPVMRRQRRGRIVNCSSVLGFVAVRFTGVYSASKYAIEALSDTLRLELAGTGIHVSLLQPGPIHSRMLENARIRFLETTDIRNSPFLEEYRREISRLNGGPESFTFKRGPDAVVSRLIHALESPSPRARYRVTIPSKVGAALKRVLPTRMLDRVLIRQR